MRFKRFETVSRHSAATAKGQRRRRAVGAGLALAVTSLQPRAQTTSPSRYVQPDAQGWPDASQWAQINEAVGGGLSRLAQPDLSDPATQKLLTNPFYIGEQAGLTQNSGWLDAWQSSPSAYAVAATSAADVAATVDFARHHNVRLVVKGGGHSYVGGSSAPGSLLIWTRPMNTVCGANGPQAFSGSLSLDRAKGVKFRSRVTNAITTLRAVAPGAGTYLNECDYFQADWKEAFWGANYSRLLAIKRRYDPAGLFTVHHGVGSEI